MSESGILRKEEENVGKADLMLDQQILSEALKGKSQAQRIVARRLG